MINLITMLSGAALGAGTMYLLDPERGARRRDELRQALAAAGNGELVDRARRLEPLARARRLEPLAAARDLGSGLLEAGWPAVGDLASRGWKAMPAMPAMPRGRRRRSRGLGPRDWALLGGFAAAMAAGLWLLRRQAGAGGDVEVTRTLTVDAPVERVYEFWNDFENLPRFLSHVREVRRTGPDRTRWVVNGPAGAPVEWEAVVTRRAPNEEIAWRTTEGALVAHEGSVRFRPAGAGSTRLEVHMSYHPAGGALGQSVAALLGSDPARLIGEDLARMAAQLRGTRPAVGESGPRR